MDNSMVLGAGFVGRATMKSLDIPHFFSRSESNITLAEASKKQFIFICLPTPTDANGDQTEGRRVIHDYIAQIKEYGNRNIFVIRSTVIPGTCRALSDEFGVMVASNPEFLSEDTWEHDAESPRIIVVGADAEPARVAVSNLYKDKKCRIKLSTDTVTAETFKYAFNSFMTTKIVWANSVFDVCEKNGANYNTIKKALYKHPWGSKYHFRIVDKGGRGAGGHCFPKDIKAFSTYSNNKFLKMVEEVNREYLQTSGKV